MLVSIFRMVFLLLYLIIVSQGIFYLFAAGKAFAGISMDAYAEIRNSIDQVIEWRLKLVYPVSLLIGFLVVIIQMKTPSSVAFVSTAIAFVCLIVDLAMAFTVNMPINTHFHTYNATMLGTDWELLRKTWLQFLEYRAMAQIVGFLALLIGYIK